jgi:hypothetical protein
MDTMLDSGHCRYHPAMLKVLSPECWNASWCVASNSLLLAIRFYEQASLTILKVYSPECWNAFWCVTPNSLLSAFTFYEQASLTMLKFYSPECWNAFRCVTSNSLLLAITFSHLTPYCWPSRFHI